MIGVGQQLPDFKIVGVKPGFMRHEEGGQSAFETLTAASFPGQWKVIFFYPKDFTFVCPTEIAEFARLNPQFADPVGRFAQALGVLDQADGVAQRATLVVDPNNVVQHIYVTSSNVGRAPADTLRVLDALQTDELCPCNRQPGGEVLKAA